MNFEELKNFLDEKADQYNHAGFIEQDPVQVPHRFSLKQDIEIAGFLTATISWGNRKSILNSAEKMLSFMDHAPYDFVMNFSEKDLQPITGKPLHRTFNGDDLAQFIRNLGRVYRENRSLEELFLLHDGETNFYHSLERFRTVFLGTENHRSFKHVSSTYKNSSAKRLMMFLRWMVRNDGRKVDFGIWPQLDQKFLSVPLDVHTGNVSRKLELITRKQNDWKTVEEMDLTLRRFDASDPARYDFALFGMGVAKEI
ncbi:MAG: TIGR02757 family protein [Weeksellaceae bacterium]|nr:TIGR02757 family protein [Weeksellaceae bacterium]